MELSGDNLTGRVVKLDDISMEEFSERGGIYFTEGEPDLSVIFEKKKQKSFNICRVTLFSIPCSLR